MRIQPLSVALALALALAACGGDEPTEDAAPPAADGAVEVVGNDSVQWAQDEVDAVAVDGTVDLTLRCDGAVPHNVVIEGVTGADGTDAVLAECSGNDSATATVDVEPGTYTFYCSVTGHREAGMEGTLTVS